MRKKVSEKEVVRVEKFVCEAVKLLVDHEDQVKVHGVIGESCVILEVTVADKDFGQLLGKRGRNVDGLRNVLQAFGKKGGNRFELEPLDPARPRPERFFSIDIDEDDSDSVGNIDPDRHSGRFA